uniref:Uncharacterized protein n=1 Tax=Timema monikensis TaxID=170555 RepID=A0A7R9EFX5_9NEOP|nr:unnamed protein product [Timema monikensis]
MKRLLKRNLLTKAPIAYHTVKVSRCLSQHCNTLVSRKRKLVDKSTNRIPHYEGVKVFEPALRYFSQQEEELVDKSITNRVPHYEGFKVVEPALRYISQQEEELVDKSTNRVPHCEGFKVVEPLRYISQQEEAMPADIIYSTPSESNTTIDGTKERECPVTQKVAMLNKIPILTKTCPSPSPGVLTPPRFVFGSVLSSSRLDAPPATPPSGSTSPSSSIDGSTAPMTPSKPLLLRPSQLALGSTSAANTSSFSLLTTGLSNSLSQLSKNNEYSSENSVFKEGGFPVLESLKTSPIQVMPKFVPLGTPSKQREDSATTATSITTTTPPRSFVFGQNLHERIAGDAVTGQSTERNAPPTEESTSTNNVTINKSAVATTNGTSEMLFTSVIKMDNTGDSGGERSGKSLSEAAREYEEARAVKRKYDQVAVVTGEEGEHNVLQV